MRGSTTATGTSRCGSSARRASFRSPRTPLMAQAPLKPSFTPVSGRRVSCKATPQPSNHEPTRRQFNQLGFVRVRLERVTTTKQGHYGYLVFVRHEGRRSWLGGAERGLVVHITGDTLYCLCKLLRNEATARPMPLDILSGILTQASSQSPDEWGILRVAITDLVNDTYIARVFFGNRRTGEVSWEQDIRPSDATYLAEQWQLPFYIDSRVWEDTAITHSELQESERNCEEDTRREEQQGTNDATVSSPNADHDQQVPGGSAPTVSGIKMADPEVVKMIKRQMEIAVSEENYTYAARLRDSPIMQLYLEVQRLKDKGDLAAALDLEDELNAASVNWSFGGQGGDRQP